MGKVSFQAWARYQAMGAAWGKNFFII